jgi:hypothetical protein
MPKRRPIVIPPGFRIRLENVRLDLLALFRALDRMDLSPAEIPQRLIRQLFHLDADCAEALSALDQPPGRMDLTAMLQDTLASLEQIPHAVARFKAKLPSRAHPMLETLEASIRQTLHPKQAYNQVPGRD